MMTKKFYSVSLMLLGTLLLSVQGFGSNNQAGEGEEQTIYSKDSLFSVSIFKNWEQITEHSEAVDLQAKNDVNNSHFIALMEDKEDGVFEEWIEESMGKSLKFYDDVSVSEGEDVVIDGKPAKQYEVKATAGKGKMILLLTYVNGEDYFAQIVAMSVDSKQSPLDELKAMTNSVKGL